ncbi:nucleotide sugar dehydrogenase [Dietzia kunjamensis]|uniref:nucleotide sugar dehydrogenase n=1 Tax=Dietzia kunjamensis TaxID=322509 RepID=UPI000E765A85|nr:nucleotide sugar dehydrogenase [Dietzia kunjamensis]MBB1012574.1 nucleotide sugar dehydrogenase [Dietzia kunjamensis]RKE59501.1 nucleotide sugar dehydrogenase [Dietzia kunjamensis]
MKVVVVGLGYVGLPLVRELVRSDHEVQGFDVSEEVASSLNAGRSHIDDLSDDDISAMKAGGFKATTDPRCLANAEVVVICVPTPLSQEGGPDLRFVNSASKTVAENISPKALVVLESTTFPGTTGDIVAPYFVENGLVVGETIYLAYSPERVDPGNKRFDTRNTPKVVGGVTKECGERARSFYSSIVDEVVEASGCKEAELAKLLENTYRHVNIALVNEMVKFCHDLQIDFWEVVRLASTKPFGFQAFYPGPGVGGHCIPIDPNYLSHQVKAELGYPFRFVELAQEINNSMPKYVSDRVAKNLNRVGRSVKGSKILLLGVTYKKNISDVRESPATPLARYLLSDGAELSYWDPFVENWSVDGCPVPRCTNLREEAVEADLAIVVQDHDSMLSDVSAWQVLDVIDTRGVLAVESNVERL